MKDFEELQATWAKQNQEDMYTINHEALRNQVQRKKDGADRFSDRVEKFLIGSQLVVGGGLLVLEFIKTTFNGISLAISLSMLGLAAYVIYVRLQRLRASGTFDRSLQGDVQQAISDTRHRVRISRMGLLYIPLIGGLSLWSLWAENRPVWVLALLTVFFFVAFGAGVWEHRSWHAGRLEELESLREEMERYA